MTIVLEQRNNDITELRKQNRDNSSKDSEKVNLRILRDEKSVVFFHKIFFAHFKDVLVWTFWNLDILVMNEIPNFKIYKD